MSAKTQYEFCDILGVAHLYSEKFFKALQEYIFPKIPAVKSSKKLLDFDEDFRLLWADFKAAYNIDLLNDNINWWQFQALFERLSLLDGVSGLNKVIGYRAAKIPKQTKDNRDHIKHIQNMKARYRLEEAEQDNIGKTLERAFYNKNKKK